MGDSDMFMRPRGLVELDTPPLRIPGRRFQAQQCSPAARTSASPATHAALIRFIFARCRGAAPFAFLPAQLRLLATASTRRCARLLHRVSPASPPASHASPPGLSQSSHLTPGLPSAALAPAPVWESQQLGARPWPLPLVLSVVSPLSLKAGALPLLRNRFVAAFVKSHARRVVPTLRIWNVDLLFGRTAIHSLYVSNCAAITQPPLSSTLPSYYWQTQFVQLLSALELVADRGGFGAKFTHERRVSAAYWVVIPAFCVPKFQPSVHGSAV